MLTNLLYILLAVVIIGIIVTVHEFGHYLVGRLCGIGIVEFSVGFGPRLFGFTRSGIKYSLRLIPLGGYCAFVGEDRQDDDPRAMNNQPVWKRFLTVLAGPAMNFVLAFIVCAAMLHGYMTAETYPVVASVIENMPAEAAGLQAGDRIIAIDGAEITNDGYGVSQVSKLIQSVDPGSPVTLTILRGDEQMEVTMNTQAVETTSEDGTSTSRHGMIGIYFTRRTYTLAEALRYSGQYMVSTTRMMLDSLRGMFFHGENIDKVTGTVGIIAVVSEYAKEGMEEILWLMFVISLNLGIVNLLPIPALDGGRLVFLIVEAIRRKPVPPEKEGLVHGIGLLVVFGLFILLTFHDIYRLIIGGVQGLL